MEDTNTIMSFLLKPFFLGLYTGLILCIILFIKMQLKYHELKKELKTLKKHLHTKLEIDAEANEEKKAIIDRLKEENENLRITVQTLSNKPGRKEIKQFHVYQKALDILFEKAPGFAPAWQNALRDGETEIKKVDKGFIPFIKRISGGALLEPASDSSIDRSDDKRALPDNSDAAE